MLNLKFRYRFEAAHRFLGSSSVACMTPHGHTWHASLNLNFTGKSLNSSSMAVEFTELKADWKRLITSTFDHSYMHHWQDPVAETLKATQPETNLIPFPGDPTTELIALLMFKKMDQIISSGPYKELVEVQTILIEETPTNHIACGREFYQQEYTKYQDFTGWWQSTNTDDRSLARKS